MSVARPKPPQLFSVCGRKQDVQVSYPDEALHDAMARILKCGIGRLPVVDRNDARRVLGYLGRGDILAARLRNLEEEELRHRGPLLAA